MQLELSNRNQLPVICRLYFFSNLCLVLQQTGKTCEIVIDSCFVLYFSTSKCFHFISFARDTAVKICVPDTYLLFA